ncbi:hypothetical protein [Flavobacterium haoranii]|nr:hypothetical protein [Flavobacterium haoranii]
MNKQRLSVFMSASLGALATFMPWSSVPLLGDMNGINTTLGKFSILFFSFSLIISLLGNKMKDLKGWSFKLIIFTSMLALLIDLLHLFVLSFGKPNEDNPLEKVISEQMRIEFGLYIGIFSGIMTLLFLFTMKSNAKELNKKTRKLEKHIRKDEKIIKISNQKIEETHKAKESKLNNNFISELKKESELVKDFEPSDHNKYMPK